MSDQLSLSATADKLSRDLGRPVRTRDVAEAIERCGIEPSRKTVMRAGWRMLLHPGVRTRHWREDGSWV